jgi:hypothetical protein
MDPVSGPGQTSTTVAKLSGLAAGKLRSRLAAARCWDVERALRNHHYTARDCRGMVNLE